ncbi:MAG: hypothetical protein PWP23_3111 [Candidatus Sumerlaeota bacterium]|nr:hypothetical protein [Candidatus Sumerlaeota bacterium]
MSADVRLRRWADAHAAFGERLRQSLNIAERGETAEPRTVDERLLQCVWFDQLLDAGKLVTASGKRLEVLEVGRWNVGPGPDFQGARIRLAGEELSGDIEIHLRSSGWQAHGHHQDFEYNNVVLHVCLEAADDRPYEEKQNGTRLERLLIAHALEPDLETLRRTLNVNDYPQGRPAYLGLCHEQFLALPAERRRNFFAIAGRARIEERIGRYRAQLATASQSQLIYQSLMVAQGFKASKTLYFLLSKRAPCSELLDLARDVPAAQHTDLFLSILLHTAQLFPTQPDFFDGLDDESAVFVRRLAEHWQPVRPYFTDRLMPPTRRWFSGMRPPGFPGRRLAAVAILLARLADRDAPLFEMLRARFSAFPAKDADAKAWKQLFAEAAEMLAVEGTGHYFHTHFTLGGKPCRPQALLGEPAARTTLYNVILPLLVLSARQDKDAVLEEVCWAALERFPALPRNSVTDFMKRRLLGDSGEDKALFRTELANQALIHVFQSCCAHNERTCDQCTFLNQ